jgi:hypothetical protein
MLRGRAGRGWWRPVGIDGMRARAPGPGRGGPFCIDGPSACGHPAAADHRRIAFLPTPLDAALQRPPTLESLLWLALAALGQACVSPYAVTAAGTAVREEPIEFPEPTVQLLEVQLHRGTILVQNGPALQGSIRMEVAADTADEAARIAAMLEPLATQTGPGRTLLAVALPQGADLESVVTSCQLIVPEHTSVLVRTREGAVTTRGLGGAIEVRGGTGNVEIQMGGGPVQVATSTGRMQVRGSFRDARLKTASGHIDLQTPVDWPLVLDVSAGDGEVWIDLGQVEALDVEFRGLPSQVRAAPDVRVDWHEVRVAREMEREVEYHLGRFGEWEGQTFGRLYLSVDRGTVHVRRTAATPPG